MNCKATLTTLLGCLLIIIGVVIPVIFPTIFEAKLAEKLVISPGSEMMKNFEKTPIPIYFQIYIFNVTNPEEVYEGETPILDQKGPYTYRQERSKHNITWNHDLGTVSYNEQKQFFFIPDKSAGSEDDVITTLNPVFVSMGAKAEKMNAIVKNVMQLWTWQFEDFQLFMSRKVKELTFSGYEDPVVLELYKMSENPKYASGKTGFLYPKNGTMGPSIEIYSGEMGMDNYQKIYKFKGNTELHYWNGARCNVLNGTLGSQFPKPILKNEPLFMFSGDLCRSLYLSYEKDTKLGPLTLHRFTNQVVFKVSDPANTCYCGDDKFTCRNSMVSVESCKDGAPIVMSSPHFLMADEEDINMVEGLHPVRSEHQTFIEIEPNTGVLMRASKRIQVNMALKRYSAFSDFDEVKEVIFPILWVNESVEVPLARAEALHENLTGPKNMVGNLSLIIVVVGSLLVFVVFLSLCCSKRKQLKTKERQEMIDKEANRKVIHGLLHEKIKY